MKKLIIKEIKMFPHALMNNQLTLIQFIALSIALFSIAAIVLNIVDPHLIDKY
ncbi:hypothetical protein [Mucilaginibacter kameinonensis]|uniref:hypothetical protein n=1 Tax=Mucilaginibacter kameinonensis TaxID=452286 RepID=UPI0013CEE709|nr:hypothetical protein [Mucilaginibacter kameinonensis]